MSDRRANTSLIATARPRRKDRPATKVKNQRERLADPGALRKRERQHGARHRVRPDHPDIPF